MAKYVTSDSHFGHENIVLGVSKWEDKSICRKFETLEEHNAAIVKGINDYVKKDDILFHIGDWSLGGLQNIWEFRKQIICENIHLVLGNHDHHIANNKLLENSMRTQELFTSVSQVIHREIRNIDFTMYHCSQRTWFNGKNGAIMLFGHSHGNLPEFRNSERKLYKTMDVGVDVAHSIFGEYRPFSIEEEILEIMKDRINLIVD